LGQISVKLFRAQADFCFLGAASAHDPEDYRARGEAHGERNHSKDEHE